MYRWLICTVQAFALTLKKKRKKDYQGTSIEFVCEFRHGYELLAFASKKGIYNPSVKSPSHVKPFSARKAKVVSELLGDLCSCSGHSTGVRRLHHLGVARSYWAQSTTARLFEPSQFEICTAQVLRRLFPGQVFVHCRPEWLRSPITGRCLEADFYCEARNLIIEVQGIQHVQYIPHMHETTS